MIPSMIPSIFFILYMISELLWCFSVFVLCVGSAQRHYYTTTTTTFVPGSRFWFDFFRGCIQREIRAVIFFSFLAFHCDILLCDVHYYILVKVCCIYEHGSRRPSAPIIVTVLLCLVSLPPLASTYDGVVV